jgi:hypothetical protein
MLEAPYKSIFFQIGEVQAVVFCFQRKMSARGAYLQDNRIS